MYIPIENISRGIDEPSNPLLMRAIGYCTIAGEILMRYNNFDIKIAVNGHPKEAHPLHQSERKRKKKGSKSESIINTTSELLKARNFFICLYFSFYEQLKLCAQLS